MKIIRLFFKQISFFGLIFSLLIFISCDSASLVEETELVENSDSQWGTFISKNFLDLDGKVFSTEWDGIKFFVDGNEFKFFQSESLKNSLCLDNKEKSFDKLQTDLDGETCGSIVAVLTSNMIPDNGKMLLLKTEVHQNWEENSCYGDSSIGTEEHSDCYIPIYLSIKKGCVIQACYYSASLVNNGATGTACFKNYQKAKENLFYDSDIYAYKTTYNENK